MAIAKHSAMIEKPQIYYLLNDRNVGGVTTSVQSLMRSPLAEKFDFRLVSPMEAIAARTHPDLAVFNDACSWRQLPTLCRLRWRGKLLIQDHHYCQGFEAHSVPSKWRFRLMLRLAFALAHRVVAVSHGQAQWMLQHKLLDRRKLVVIQQCRTLEPFLAIAEKPLGERLVLGAYGRFAAQKGIDMLIQAVRQLPDLPLELRISGYGEQEALLHQLADGDRRIQFAGKLDDVPAFLAGCDAIVIPSRWEPWGNVCLEVKAAGKPAIVTKVDGLPEQVVDCGLVVEPTIAGLRAAIAEIAEVFAVSPQSFLAWGRRGRAEVRLAWEEYLAQWLAIFEEMTESFASASKI